MQIHNLALKLAFIGSETIIIYNAYWQGGALKPLGATLFFIV